MATPTDNNNNPAQENPNKTLDPTEPDPIPATEDATATKGSDAKDPADADADAITSPPPDSGNDAPLSDIQKKMRRAERFGISVQLSEKEKRNSRAERSIPNHHYFIYLFMC